MYRLLSLLGFLVSCALAKQKAEVISLNEETWPQLLEGEWLVKFYAPWCPACRALAPTWDGVAGWSIDLDIKVAEIDVSDNPGLSGRFLVTSLPTIFHVHSGEFRVYRGPRTENDIIDFVDDKKWKDLEPVPWYISPTAIHMSALGLFFKASMSIRDLHNKMTTDYGIPVWGSYAIFAVATIIFGLLLGLLIVFLCDCMLPNSPPQPSYLSTRPHPPGYKPTLPDDDDKDSDIVVDDLPTSRLTPAVTEAKANEKSAEDKAENPSNSSEKTTDVNEDEKQTKDEEEISDKEPSEEEEGAAGGDVKRPKSARRRKLKATTD